MAKKMSLSFTEGLEVLKTQIGDITEPIARLSRTTSVTPATTPADCKCSQFKELDTAMECLLDADRVNLIKISVQGKTINIIKEIVVKKCPKFYEFLEGKMSTSGDAVVALNKDEINYEILRNFVRFLYTGSAILYNIRFAVDMLQMAAQFDVLSLKPEVIQFIESNLSTDNCLEVLLTGREMACKALENAALNFLFANRKLLAKFAGYEQLQPEVLRLILEYFSVN